MKNKRVLIVSCSIIMLCLCIIVGMSYALFTSSVSVGDHLQAGNLNISLTRTDLEYSVLDANGELKTITVEEDLDLTTASESNAFGIDSTDIRIVPGSYFDADFKITNVGNTAFTYTIDLKLLGSATALAEQLKVTVTHPDGSTTETMLSELTANGLSIGAGKMKVGEGSQSFGVRVEFIDNSSINNAAQNGTAAFDLVVTAVQATAENS